MVGHIMLPAWQRTACPGLKDSEMLPASLAPEIIQGLLRGELAFNGLIVSDATTMTGFTAAMKREDAVPACIQAGCDMFLFNMGLKSDFEYMLRGIERGALTLARLDEAVTRILALKASLGLQARKEKNELVPGESRLEVIASAEHESWARECAAKAVTLVKDRQGLLPLDLKRHRRILMHVLGDAEKLAVKACGESSSRKFKNLLEAEGFSVVIFDEASFDEGMLQRPPEAQVANCDLILYWANLGGAGYPTVIRPSWTAPFGLITPKFIQEKETLFVSVSSPYHLQDVPRIKTFVNAYTPSDYVVEAVAARLLGKAKFEGQSPVDPFCGLWDTRL